MPERALVAVVDDDPTLATLLVDVLELGGFDTIVIGESADAPSRIGQVRPRVVLLDVRIEHRQLGWQIVEQLAADPCTASIPVVICTADEGFLREHASDLAVRGVPCLPKPFEIDDLIAAVSRAALGGLDDTAGSLPGAAT